VLEDSPAELEHARALTDLGAALRRTGKRSEAREPLRAGLDLAQRCHATALVQRAHDELVASGARPRRFLLTGVDSLTASERRVAEMASEGLTNREIAQALFVTEKTVEGHLGHAYRKLDVRSRSELPRALIRRPSAE
jgi:DNA-binding CsgD family transcriptional regulator